MASALRTLGPRREWVVAGEVVAVGAEEESQGRLEPDPAALGPLVPEDRVLNRGVVAAMSGAASSQLGVRWEVPVIAPALRAAPWRRIQLPGAALDQAEVAALAEAIAASPGLEEVTLAGGTVGTHLVHLATAMARRRTPLRLDVTSCDLTQTEGVALAAAIRANALSALLASHNTNLGPRALQAIGEAAAQSPALAELDLAGTGTGAAFAACAVAGPSGLRALNLGCCDLRADAVAALAAALLGNRKLQRLALVGNGFGPAGMAALGAALGASAVTTLHVGANGLGPEGGRILASVLRQSTTLQVLSVWNNAMGEAGVGALATALRLSALRELDVRANDLRGGRTNELEGASPLRQKSGPVLLRIGRTSAGLLAENATALRSLDLGENPLGSGGALAVATALPDALGDLGLERADLGDEDAAELASVLRGRRGALTLRVAGNRFTRRGVAELTDAANINRGLTVHGLPSGGTLGQLAELRALRQGSGQPRQRFG